MKHPNLLFIYTDEQAYGTLAAYGNRQISMPNLDRLARQSIVFDQAYVTQPVCTPSRSTLLTGTYPHTNGCIENNVPLLPEMQCLPEMMPAGRYVTGHYGKWHLGDELYAQHGFQEWISIEDAYNAWFSAGRDRSIRSSYHHFLLENGFRPHNGDTFGRGEAARLPEEYSKPAYLAREASQFLRRNRHEPFILYVNFLEPHMPFFGPRDSQYDPHDIRLPLNFEVELDGIRPLKARAFAEAYREWGHSSLTLQTPDDWRRMIANYWGLCSLVDTHVGTILSTLDACRLTDDTIVVFTSDHGDMMGSHGLLGKCVMFEEAVRVPLVIHLPGQTQGKRVSGPVSQIDIVPTLLDLMGQPVPPQLQGESLRGLLLDDRAKSTKDVFIEWNGSNTGIVGEERGQLRIPRKLQDMLPTAEVEAAVSDPIRTIITPYGWKLNWSARGEHELFDLWTDPGEMTNLIGRKEYASVVRELETRVHLWQERANDAACR